VRKGASQRLPLGEWSLEFSSDGLSSTRMLHSDLWTRTSPPSDSGEIRAQMDKEDSGDREKEHYKLVD
jgi:hypothetical protein